MGGCRTTAAVVLMLFGCWTGCSSDDDANANADAATAPDMAGFDAAEAGRDAGPADTDQGPADAGAPDLSGYVVSPGVYTFDGLDPELPTADLASVDVLIGDADVVGLGESIHTSGGYSQAKVRLIEHLVRDLGFRLVAFESPPAGAETVDDYARSCEGDPETAVRALHNIWWDQSVAELTSFLCDFNRTHAGDPARFIGFDNRQPWVDEPALREWLSRAAPSEGAALADGLAPCFGVGYPDEDAFFMDPEVMDIFMERSMRAQEDHDACAAGAGALQGFMQMRREALVAASSADEWERMRLALRRIESFDTQAYHFFGRGEGPQAQAARDAVMADVLLTTRRLDHPGARTVVWAHNYHVSRNSDTLEGVTVYRGSVNLGTHLQREPGLRYVAIGLSSYEVRYDWFMGADQYLQDSADAIERLLHEVGDPYLFVSIAEASTGGATLLEPDGLYLVSGEGMLPREHYDGLVFLDVSAPATWIGGESPFARFADAGAP